jgi:hypothetical protein
VKERRRIINVLKMTVTAVVAAAVGAGNQLLTATVAIARNNHSCSQKKKNYSRQIVDKGHDKRRSVTRC